MFTPFQLISLIDNMVRILIKMQDFVKGKTLIHLEKGDNAYNPVYNFRAVGNYVSLTRFIVWKNYTTLA